MCVWETRVVDPFFAHISSFFVFLSPSRGPRGGRDDDPRAPAGSPRLLQVQAPLGEEGRRAGGFEFRKLYLTSSNSRKTENKYRQNNLNLNFSRRLTRTRTGTRRSNRARTWRRRRRRRCRRASPARSSCPSATGPPPTRQSDKSPFHRFKPGREENDLLRWGSLDHCGSYIYYFFPLPGPQWGGGKGKCVVIVL